MRRFALYAAIGVLVVVVLLLVFAVSGPLTLWGEPYQ